MIAPAQQQPTIDEATKQRLMAMLAGGTAQPPQQDQPLTPTGTPAAQQPDTSAAAPPAVTSPFGPPNPAGATETTVTPVSAKPLTPVPETPTAPPVAQSPFDVWKGQNQTAGGTAPPTFTPETEKHALLRGLFSGMSEFGRPGAGFKQNEEWNQQEGQKEAASRNWPMQREENLRAAYGRDLQEQGLQASTAEAKLKAQPTLEEQFDATTAAAGNGDTGAQAKLPYLLDKLAQRKHAEAPIHYVQKEILDDRPGADPTKGRMADFANGHYYDPDTMAEIQNARPAPPKPVAGAQLPLEVAAQAGPKPDPKTFPGGEADPNYQAALVAWGKKAQDIKAAPSIAAGEARAAAFGENRPGDYYDAHDGNAIVKIPAKKAYAEPGRYTPVNAESAGALKGEAAIHGMIQNISDVRTSLANLKDGLPPDVRATFLVAARANDPNSAFQQFFSSIAKGSLSSEQFEYLNNLAVLLENAQVATSGWGGGGGSDTLRHAMAAIVPGPGTPDKEAVNIQLNAVSKLLGQREAGIPKTNLRTDTAPIDTKPGATKPAKLVNGAWVDATTGQPIPTATH